MTKKLFAVALFCALIAVLQISARAFYPSAQNERFAIRTLQMLHSAEVTYSATTGNGNYASLNNLLQANLINADLASGRKYGYRFEIQTTDYVANTPATLIITATPQHYGKTGRKSLYVDASAVIRGADKRGAPATSNDPIIENACLPNEECTIANLRTLHSAEVTYQATSGNGNFGTLNQLAAGGLVNELLARGYANGYNLTITFTAMTSSNPPTLRISAVPINYGVTGVRSFYIDESGVIRGANRNGAPATADDPAIE